MRRQALAARQSLLAPTFLKMKPAIHDNFPQRRHRIIPRVCDNVVPLRCSKCKMERPISFYSAGQLAHGQGRQCNGCNTNQFAPTYWKHKELLAREDYFRMSKKLLVTRCKQWGVSGEGMKQGLAKRLTAFSEKAKSWLLESQVQEMLTWSKWAHTRWRLASRPEFRGRKLMVAMTRELKSRVDEWSNLLTTKPLLRKKFDEVMRFFSKTPTRMADGEGGYKWVLPAGTLDEHGFGHGTDKDLLLAALVPPEHYIAANRNANHTGKTDARGMQWDPCVANPPKDHRMSENAKGHLVPYMGDRTDRPVYGNPPAWHKDFPLDDTYIGQDRLEEAKKEHTSLVMQRYIDEERFQKKRQNATIQKKKVKEMRRKINEMEARLLARKPEPGEYPVPRLRDDAPNMIIGMPNPTQIKAAFPNPTDNRGNSIDDLNKDMVILWDPDSGKPIDRNRVNFMPPCNRTALASTAKPKGGMYDEKYTENVRIKRKKNWFVLATGEEVRADDLDRYRGHNIYDVATFKRFQKWADDQAETQYIKDTPEEPADPNKVVAVNLLPEAGGKMIPAWNVVANEDEILSSSSESEPDEIPQRLLKLYPELYGDEAKLPIPPDMGLNMWEDAEHERRKEERQRRKSQYLKWD